jgi:hypothetical protein
MTQEKDKTKQLEDERKMLWFKIKRDIQGFIALSMIPLVLLLSFEYYALFNIIFLCLVYTWLEVLR